VPAVAGACQCLAIRGESDASVVSRGGFQEGGFLEFFAAYIVQLDSILCRDSQEFLVRRERQGVMAIQGQSLLFWLRSLEVIKQTSIIPEDRQGLPIGRKACGPDPRRQFNFKQSLFSRGGPSEVPELALAIGADGCQHPAIPRQRRGTEEAAGVQRM